MSNISTMIEPIFVALVTVGVIAMILRNPQGANAILAAGANTITGTTRALEGRA